jgi:hypothetical protein
MDQQPTAPATTGEQSPNTQPCLCLAVTEVSNFVRLQYCERYLALLYERKQLKGGIYALSSLADPSYKEHGQIAEGEVEKELEKYNYLKLCPKKTKEGVKEEQKAQIQWEDFVEALKNELENFSSDREKKYYAREVEICTKVHDFCLIGRIDFILVDITKVGEQNTGDNTPNQRQNEKAGTSPASQNSEANALTQSENPSRSASTEEQNASKKPINLKLTIIEVKATRHTRSYHYLQLAQYHYILERGASPLKEYLEQHLGLPSENITFAYRLVYADLGAQEISGLFEEPPRESPIGRFKPETFEITKEDLPRLLAEEGPLMRVKKEWEEKREELLKRPYVLNSRCDYCPVNIPCLLKAHENKDIELLGLSFNANYVLREEGLKTIDDLAKRDDRENEAKLKNAISKMDVPIHPEEIRRRAEVNMKRYKGNPGSMSLSHKGTSEEDPLEKGYGNLPDYTEKYGKHKDLIRVYLIVEKDPLMERLNALVAHVVMKQAPPSKDDDEARKEYRERFKSFIRTKYLPLSPPKWKPEPLACLEAEQWLWKGEGDSFTIMILRTSQWKGGKEDDCREHGMIRCFLKNLTNEIKNIANGENIKIHFYVWSHQDVKDLLSAILRGGENAVGTLKAFWHLMGLRPEAEGEQLIYSSLKDEIAFRYAVSTTALSVLTLTYLFNSPGQGWFAWPLEVERNLWDSLFSFVYLYKDREYGNWDMSSSDLRNELKRFPKPVRIEVRSCNIDAIPPKDWRKFWKLRKSGSSPSLFESSSEPVDSSTSKKEHKDCCCSSSGEGANSEEPENSPSVLKASPEELSGVEPNMDMNEGVEDYLDSTSDRLEEEGPPQGKLFAFSFGRLSKRSQEQQLPLPDLPNPKGKKPSGKSTSTPSGSSPASPSSKPLIPEYLALKALALRWIEEGIWPKNTMIDKQPIEKKKLLEFTLSGTEDIIETCIDFLEIDQGAKLARWWEEMRKPSLHRVLEGNALILSNITISESNSEPNNMEMSAKIKDVSLDLSPEKKDVSLDLSGLSSFQENDYVRVRVYKKEEIIGELTAQIVQIDWDKKDIKISFPKSYLRESCDKYKYQRQPLDKQKSQGQSSDKHKSRKQLFPFVLDSCLKNEESYTSCYATLDKSPSDFVGRNVHKRLKALQERPKKLQKRLKKLQGRLKKLQKRLKKLQGPNRDKLEGILRELEETSKELRELEETSKELKGILKEPPEACDPLPDWINICRKCAEFLKKEDYLNESQAKALDNLLSSRIFLLQGPPGTGKTQTTAVAILMYALCVLDEKGGCIAVASHTNTAIENLYDRVVKMFSKLSEAKQDQKWRESLNKIRLCYIKYCLGEKEIKDKQTGDEKCSQECRGCKCGNDQNVKLILFGTTSDILKLFQEETEKINEKIRKKEQCILYNKEFLKPFDVLVVDEASMMVFPHFVALASLIDYKKEWRIMLAGDHRQLSPIVHREWEEEDRPGVQRFLPYMSVFEWFLQRKEEAKLNDTQIKDTQIKVERLSHSHRLPLVLRRLIQPLYDRDKILLTGKSANSEKDASKSTFKSIHSIYSYIANTPDALYLLVHDEQESTKSNPLEAEIVKEIVEELLHKEITDKLLVHKEIVEKLLVRDEQESTKSNPLEAEIAKKIVKEIVEKLPKDSQDNSRKSITPKDIAVVTPFRRHRALLKETLKDFVSEGLVVDTVERLQGGERKVIIYSAAVSSPSALMDLQEFILDVTRTNVAFSRAQEKLIVVVSQSVLDYVPVEEEQYEDAVLWKSLRRICSRKLLTCEYAVLGDDEKSSSPGLITKRPSVCKVTLFGVDPDKIHEEKAAKADSQEAEPQGAETSSEAAS